MINREVGRVVGGQIIGGGYKGETAALDQEVRRAAELMQAQFGRSVSMRFNSNRRSGGAWIIGGYWDASVGLNVTLESDGTLSYQTGISLKETVNTVDRNSKYILCDDEFRPAESLEAGIRYLADNVQTILV